MKTEESPRGSLKARDWRKQAKAAVVWSAPALLIWINQALGVISQPNHVFAWNDLAPSAFTTGALVAWSLSQIQGIILRWLSETK